MIISISTNTNRNDFDPSHQNFFKPVALSSAKEFASMITTRVWSPIIWKGGKRHSDNFLSCNYLVLDFDDGRWTIEDASSFCKHREYKYIIGTTKSHQIAKGKLSPCDRFRLIIPWQLPIIDLKTYKQNMTRLFEIFPCDRLCKDGARPYIPCKKIVEMGDGRPIPWFPYKPPRVFQPKRESCVLPNWVLSQLRTIPEEGRRNNHAFQVAMSLARFGFSENQVIYEVLRAPIDLPDSEKIIAAKSGYKIGITKRQT